MISEGMFDPIVEGRESMVVEVIVVSVIAFEWCKTAFFLMKIILGVIAE